MADAPWTTAQGWDRWHDWMATQMRSVVSWYTSAARIAPGMRVLDVASGTGMPALEVATRVQPGGTVVATDVAADMLAALGRRATASGLTNVELCEIGAEDLRFPDRSFDAVTCGFGVMFCPDPVKAVSEMRRVLRPGGRLAVTVWDEPARSPFFTTVFGAVGKLGLAPPPDPKGPPMFRLAPPGALEGVLRAAGVSDIVVEALPLVFEFESADEHWAMFSEVTPPVRNAVMTQPPQRIVELRTVIADAIAPFASAGGRFRLPAAPLAASGTAP